MLKVTELKAVFKKEGFQKYFKNTSWMLLEKVFRIFVSLIVGAWVTRYLGPSDYGAFQFAFSVVTIFSAIATLGLDEIVVRELVKNEQRKNKLLGTSFILKIIGSLISILLLLIVTMTFDNEPIVSKMILIIGSSTLFHCFNVIDLHFRSRVISKYVTYANFFSLLASSILKIILILTNASLVSFAIVALFEGAILALGYIYYYSKSETNGSIFNWTFDTKLAKELLSNSWPLIFASMILMIQSRIDQVMLKELSGNEEVGYYSSALKFIEMLAFLPVILQNSLLPSLINSKKVSEKHYQERLLNYYRLNVILFIVTAVPLFLFSGFIITTLYGDAYLAAIPLLSFMSLRVILTNMAIARAGFVNIENLFKFSMFTIIIGTVVNILLNYFLIPEHLSMGAIFATLVSLSVTIFMVDFFYAKTRRNAFMQIKSMLTFYAIKINFLKEKNNE